MTISGFFFISWRLFEIVLLIPIVGMMAYMVHGFVDANILTPNFILVMFVTSVLALAWALFTTLAYFRARHDALFVALVDIGFMGALIAAVVELRQIGSTNCSSTQSFTSTSLFLYLGPFGAYGLEHSISTASEFSKNCSILKACFALGIIEIISFFMTFVFALFVHRHHRDDNKVVVKREYHTSRHSNRNSSSRDHRSSRDYDRRPRASSSGRRSTHRSSSRPSYYV